ncbi:Substrate-specific component BioY of biotin ECF transporter [Olavius algarvensis spirochete endosymbiont]|uniref:biotin transporter BioY n=1 Tax=Olavius algarvensis spirochete endosymbiont TaxID=260710 RepID=UPI00052CFD8D|nr:biotin transporter BioY [Olavius algarvensis spirochete endosymbiont]KGM38290.1 hypothetical protein JY97_17210 [Alkalispirochaeta odontotermitis]VDB01213.1 Substrate-specific component BioY of biotin ECF transporter [Olavius algarvensis spirochete endosymbiont]
MKDAPLRSLVLIAAFTALIIVGAIFSFPAPWNPVVPFTLSTLFVILAGLMLGPWRGAAAAGMYLFLGILGLPVFAGARGGIQILIGPTGGFLIGYPLAAILAGLIATPHTLFFYILASFIGSIAIYIPGLPWMHYQLTGIVEDWSWVSTWTKYTLPFLIGDAIKALAAAAIAYSFKDRIA